MIETNGTGSKIWMCHPRKSKILTAIIQSLGSGCRAAYSRERFRISRPASPKYLTTSRDHVGVRRTFAT